MKTADILSFFDSWAPPSLAEDYDNVGLLVGKKESQVSKILVSLDATEEVVEEAASLGCELIVIHHPILFKGLKKLNGQNYVARTVEAAIRKNIGLLAVHTNLDAIQTGVNRKMAQKLSLQNPQILRKAKGKLLQLSFFVPIGNREEVLKAIHATGAGQIGNYSHCGFYSEGTGQFMPGEFADPALGRRGVLETVQEARVEVILPLFMKSRVLQALKDSHPYEEVPYFFTPLDNEWQDAGAGMVGDLPEALPKEDFIALVKKEFGLHMLRHTYSAKKEVRKVALCGGSGFFLLGEAIAAGADAYLTSDIKYHEFFDSEGKLMLMDLGHFESEQFTPELIFEELSIHFPNIAVLLSKTRTNPVFYA
jgi:dinuclear metal center YbgI/SA1388 family protein